MICWIKTQWTQNQWFWEILITAVCSGLVAWVTAKRTLKYEIKRNVYEKREEVYYGVFQYMLQLITDPTIIFSNVNNEKLKDLHIKMGMYGSEKINNVWNKFYHLINGRYIAFSKYMDNVEKDSALINIIQEVEDHYIDKNKLDKQELEQYIKNLVDLMRKNLGTKK